MGNNDLDISILDSIWLMDKNVTAWAEVMRIFIYINKYVVCGSSKLQKGMVHGCTASTTMLAGRSRSSTCRELNRIPNPWETKIRENTRQRKTITCTRQYLRGSAICLHPRSCRDITIIRKEYKVQLSSYNILSIYITRQPHHIKNPNYKMWFHNGLNRPNRPQ